MKICIKLLLLLIISILDFTQSILGQIVANGANYEQGTIYDSKVIIYVYNQFPAARNGIFTATSPWGGKATFSWSKYDSVTKSFQALPQTDINVASSTLETGIKGGYKVKIDSASIKDTSYTFWFYPHKITVSVLKNSEFPGYVPYYKYTCKYVNLDATAKTDTFIYFNPLTGDKYTLNNTLNYKWTASNNEAGILLPKASFRNTDPPTKNTVFYCSVSDLFNYGPATDSVHFRAVRVKAKMDTSVVQKADEYIITPNKCAPLKMKFLNKSENATKFTWYWGDKTDTLETESISDTSHIYLKSGEYTVKLIVEKKDCIDSATMTIIIEDPSIKTPIQNILIADGSRVFKPEYQSIKSFNFAIFSRWGKKIYEEKGQDFDKWNGWNGMLGNSLVSEGVYFYILQVTSYNDNLKGLENNGVYKGFFHVYHSK